MKKGVVITPGDLDGADWPQRMKQVGLNTLGLHSGGGGSHDVLAMLGTTAERSYREKLRATGLDYEYELHAAHALMDRQLFSSRPELFIAEKNTGKRITGGNWCASSREALHQIGLNAGALATRLEPSTHRYFFWGEDSSSGWCHCDECSGLTPSDQNLLSMNALARELQKYDPEARVAYLAYAGTLNVPEVVRPAANVFLEFAPIDRCYRHAIDDLHCSINRLVWKKLLDLLEVFEPSRTHILEYWLDVSLFSRWDPKHPVQPNVSREVIKRDVQVYHQLGIRSFTTFAVYMNGKYFEKYSDWELRQYAEIINSV